MSSKIEEKIQRSSSYNLLGVYLTFILGILTTFLTVRLLFPEEWAIIILTLTFIYIAGFICNMFPPNAQETIKYYVPHITSERVDKVNERRKFILHVYKIRLLSAFIIFGCFIFIFVLADFKGELFVVILMMSPMILFDIIKNLNTSILLAFQRFTLVFIINIVYPLIVSISLFLIYTLFFSNPLILIANVYLLASFISCIFSIVLIINKIPTRKVNKEKLNTLKKDFLNLHKNYGLHLILADVFSALSNLIVYILFIKFNLIIFITWLAICEISVNSALKFSSSNPSSYISIFSEINYQKDPNTFEKQFYQLNKFLMMFVCIIVAIMLFFIEIYVTIIYSQLYLSIVIFLQIYLFTTFSKIIIRNLFIITQSTNNTKINAQISFIQMIFNISSALLALLFFLFRALIILYLINSFLMTLIAVYIINKKLDLNLKLILFFKPFIIFVVSFIIVLPFGYFINIPITPDIYLLNIFLNNTLKFSIFTIVFYIIFYFSKAVTKEEFAQMIEIIPILNSKNNFIQNLVKIIEKFLPTENLK